MKIAEVNLSIVCTANGRFLTVDNLHRAAILLGAPNASTKDYAAATAYIRDRLAQAHTLEIEEPTGYGSPNKSLGKLHITNVTIEPTPYVPAIPILTEPRTFIALVPADKALNVARAIKEKYEKEMGKVQNRLPLTLGIVFAGRRTPLPAILDAGRRMLKQPTESELWTVKGKEEVSADSSFPAHIKLTLEKDEQSIEVKVPITMGDGTTEDVWYPYWCVNNITPPRRARQFTSADGKEWVHICNLKRDDQVSFMPSRLDFEFLDTAARRFEVSYEHGKRRGTIHPARPYYLEQLIDIEKLWTLLTDEENGLETSQIHNLIGLIEGKREEWIINQDQDANASKRVFEQAVCDVLRNAAWKSRPSEENMKVLYHAALSGQLADVVELYMRILKEKTK